DARTAGRRVPRDRDAVPRVAGILHRRRLLAAARRRAHRSHGAARDGQTRGRRHVSARDAERVRGERSLAAILRDHRPRMGPRPGVAQSSSREVARPFGSAAMSSAALLGPRSTAGLKGPPYVRRRTEWKTRYASVREVHGSKIYPCPPLTPCPP